MACKSDAVKEVDPHTAATMLRDHKVGLVEVSMYDDCGKDKMRRCFDWMIRAIYRDRCERSLSCLSYSRPWPLISITASTRADSNSVYRNPASPDVLNSPSNPWDLSRPLLSSTPTDGTPMTISSQSRASHLTNSAPTPHTPPKSPTRARSHNDLLSLAREREEREAGNQVAINDFDSRSSLPATGTNGGLTNRSSDNLDSQPVPKRQDQLSTFLPMVPGGLATGSICHYTVTQVYIIRQAALALGAPRRSLREVTVFSRQRRW